MLHFKSLSVYLQKCKPHGMPQNMASHESKQGCKDQESVQLSTTTDPGYQWESDKLTVRHHKREPRGQPFPKSVLFAVFKVYFSIFGFFLHPPPYNR